MTRRFGLLLAVLLSVTSFGTRAAAHSYDAATLTLTEVAEGTFAIDWRTTAQTLEGLREPARFPKSSRKACASRRSSSFAKAGSIPSSST